MRYFLIFISFAGLAITLIPSFFVFNLSLSLEDAKILILIGSLVWLIVSPFWINKKIV